MARLRASDATCRALTISTEALRSEIFEAYIEEMGEDAEAGDSRL